MQRKVNKVNLFTGKKEFIEKNYLSRNFLIIYFINLLLNSNMYEKRTLKKNI